MSFSYEKVSIDLLSDLSPRSTDVLSRRFGLQGDFPQTLEAIGRQHRITRERVRQLVDDGLIQVQKKAKQQKNPLQKLFAAFSGALKKSGHLSREDKLVEALEAGNVAFHVVFLLHAGPGFFRHQESESMYSFWTDKEELVRVAPIAHAEMLRHFRKTKQGVSFQELRRVPGVDMIGQKTLESFLSASKHIFQGYDGKWGLKEWPDIYPKGIRDKAHVVLKHSKHPLHFLDVAELIKELQEKLLNGKTKEVLPQTVHNELIKDSRFVLVGRGTYALADWGYQQGTVRDVLFGILKKAPLALNRETILQKALQQRHVKESTVLLNLQNKKYFVKDDQGRYYLRSV